MALHLPLGLFNKINKKPAVDWSWHTDANPVPTSPLADDIATVPLERVQWCLIPTEIQTLQYDNLSGCVASIFANILKCKPLCGL